MMPPTTKSAFLPSAGFKSRHATRHVYDHSEPVRLPTGPAVAHIFRCLETGTLRRWGVDSAIYFEDFGDN